MIELISPKRIAKETILITRLKDFGMDYFDIHSVLGWNYVLDHIWLFKEISRFIKNKDSKGMSVLDVGCGNSPFHNFVEKELKLNILGIDRPQGFCHQEKVVNADYLADFLEFEELKENSVDIVYWLSAIEHNTIENIGKLYNRSLYFLKPKGLLLITFAISDSTHWYEASQQTNLSLIDAKKIFEDNLIKGNFHKIREQYRENELGLRDRYEKRYGYFGTEDPLFVVAGLKQKKSKENWFEL